MSKDPKEGEIWFVDFEPNVGSEIDKVRRAVVVSIPGFTYLPMRIVVPIRGSRDRWISYSWLVPLHPNESNRLTKASEVDASQIHTFDLQRFRSKIGEVSSEELEAIRAAMALCLRLVSP